MAIFRRQNLEQTQASFGEASGPLNKSFGGECEKESGRRSDEIWSDPWLPDVENPYIKSDFVPGLLRQQWLL